MHLKLNNVSEQICDIYKSVPFFALFTSYVIEMDIPSEKKGENYDK